MFQSNIHDNKDSNPTSRGSCDGAPEFQSNIHDNKDSNDTIRVYFMTEELQTIF